MWRSRLTLGLLLGGCTPIPSGIQGESGTGSTSETPTVADAPTDDAIDASTATSMPGGSATGTSNDGGSSTSSSGAPTDEGTSTGDPPEPLCPDRTELVACYDFAGVGGGTLTDLSGNGNHGSVVGIGVVPGPFGEAATLDGGSEIAVPDSPSLDLTGAHTIEAWIRVDALPSSDRFGVLDNEGQYSLIIYDSVDHPDEYRCDSTAGTLYAGPVVLGAWTHVACVNDGVTLRLYVDGMEWGSSGAGGAVSTGNGDPMSIGDTSPGFDEPLDGAIGGVRVWSRALDPTELCAAAGAACSG